MTSASFALKDLRQDQIFNIPNFEIRSLNIQKNQIIQMNPKLSRFELPAI